MRPQFLVDVEISSLREKEDIVVREKWRVVVGIAEGLDAPVLGSRLEMIVDGAPGLVQLCQEESLRMQLAHRRAPARVVIDDIKAFNPRSKGANRNLVTLLMPAQNRSRRAELATDQGANGVGMYVMRHGVSCWL